MFSRIALAEILSIKDTLNGPLYYIHYIDFNKRLDEWVTQDRLELKEMQLPKKENKTPIKNGSRPGSPDRELSVCSNFHRPITPWFEFRTLANFRASFLLSPFFVNFAAA